MASIVMDSEPEWKPIHALADSPSLIRATADLLESQWPTAGGTNGRERQLLRSRKELPASFVASISTGSTTEIIGHVSVRAASEIPDGLSAIAFSVVIRPSFRRRGLGRFLMRHAEDEARLLGFTYLYLFTDDQQCFYESCDYSVCERIASIGSVSRFLNAGSLNSLQRMMSSRAAAVATADSDAGRLSGAGESVAGADAIWMRKPLVETTPHQKTVRSDDVEILMSGASLCVGEKIEHASRPSLDILQTCLKSDQPEAYNSSSCGPGGSWSGAVFDATWERQVGPSCGLAVVRILKRMLDAAPSKANASINPSQVSPHSLAAFPDLIAVLEPTEVARDGTNSTSTTPSLLTVARSRGLSAEGEVFSARSLASLCSNFCCAPMAVVPLSLASLRASLSKGLPVLVAYDRDHNTHLPCVGRGGASAHWALVRGWAQWQQGIGGGEDSGGVGGGVGGAKLLLLLSHGMSSKPFACTFTSLQKSNEQLFPPGSETDLLLEKLRGDRRWVLPCGDLPDLAGVCIAPLL